MNIIEWNKVTWYSKALAAILFILVLPAWAFYLGTQYEKAQEIVSTSNGKNYQQVTTTSNINSPMSSSHAFSCNLETFPNGTLTISDNGQFTLSEGVKNVKANLADIFNTDLAQNNEDIFPLNFGKSTVTCKQNTITIDQGLPFRTDVIEMVMTFEGSTSIEKDFAHIAGQAY